MSNYKYSVISDSPVGFWPWQDPDISKDVSGYDKNASLTTTGMDLEYLPFVSGLNTLDTNNRARSLGFSNNSHSISYPYLEIWGHGQEFTPFSVEFWVMPADTTDGSWIFAPRTSAGLIQGNGIRIQNNTITFSVGNGTPSSPSNIGATATAYLSESEVAYHVVCVYQIDSLIIYVNGELSATAGVPSGIRWSTTPTSYSTVSSSPTSSLTFVLGPVAVYKAPLNVSNVKAHYAQQGLVQSPVRIASINDGNIFYLNNADRSKAFSSGPPSYIDWQDCSLYNLTVQNNVASLRTINPLRVNSGSVTFSGSRTSLAGGKFVIVDNLENHINGGSGGIGFNVNLSSANNNGVEQGIASILDGNRRTIIDIVKKSDNKVYLRYKYRIDVAEQISELLITTPTYPSDNYVFIKFDGAAINILWNSSQVSLDLSEDAFMAPQISGGSMLYLGADSNESGFSGQVWLLNIWNSPKDINDVNSFKNNVDWFTAKLDQSLSVSQYGYVKFLSHSGNDGLTGTLAATQTVATWRPVVPSITVAVSTDDINYTNVGWHSDLPITKNPLPPLVYVRATLSTDDSLNNVPYLKQLFIDAYADNTVFGETSLDEISGMVDAHIDPSSAPITFQAQHHGAKVSSLNSSFYIKPQSMLVSEIPDGASEAVGGRFPVAKSLDFWVNIKQPGYLFYWQGSPEHSIDITSGGQLTVRGFNHLSVNGVNRSVNNSDNFSASLVNPFNKWMHICVSKTDLIPDIDDTSFPLAAGSSGSIYLDKNTAYLGDASHALVQGAGATYARVFSSTIVVQPSKTYAFSAVVWPSSGTSVVSRVTINGVASNVTHPVVAGQWNIISRNFTTGTSITSLTVDVGRDTGTAGGTLWIDDPSVVLGNAPYMTFSETSAQRPWFGRPASGGAQINAQFQYPTYYYKALTEADARDIFKRYLGDTGRTLAGVSGYTEKTTTTILRDSLTRGNENPLLSHAGWTVLKSTS